MDVVITDCDHDNVEVERAVFEAAGVSWRLERCRTERDVIERCADARVLIEQYAPMTEGVMARLPNLGFVVRYGVGYDTIDVEAAARLGIQAGNVPDYGSGEVANHALALALTLLRKTAQQNALVAGGVWDYLAAGPVTRFQDLTVGIVGFGRIGRAFAERARGFGFTLIACDRDDRKLPARGYDYVEKVGFEELMTRSDLVTLHCPLETSRNLVDRAALGLMKRGSYLVNTARGGIVVEPDLAWALDAGILAGAALDTLATEPLPADSGLRGRPNVVVTPHMAWYSEQSAIELKRKVAEEAVRFVRGEPIRYPVNTPVPGLRG